MSPPSMGQQPQFRSTITVNGERFVAPFTAHPVKQAEQHAAKFALKSLVDKNVEKIKKEGLPPNLKVVAFCKWMLHESAGKSKKTLPTYKTTRSDATPRSEGPRFISTVDFDGKTYKGDVGRSKKDAERLAARTVIKWILGQSDDAMRFFIVESIISKGKHSNLAGTGNNSQDKSTPLTAPGDDHSGATNMPYVSRNSKLPAEDSIIPIAKKPHIIEVNKEVPSEDPQMLPGSLHRAKPSNSQKLPEKKQKKGKNSKKRRVNEKGQDA